MRYVFILNPQAGKRGGALARQPEIRDYFAAHPDAGDCRLRVTDAPGAATAIAREEAAAAQSEGIPVCLVACGGDGTLMETASGMAGIPGACLGCLPCGSANDYLRCFPDAGDFTSLEALTAGHIRQVDGIRCGGHLAINLCSMGMDADVADRMQQMKRLPLVNGPLAYELAIAWVFCHRIGKDLQIEMDTADGTVTREGRYFFALAASGQYYGGGYRGAPRACPDDGLLDFVLVRAMPRVRIPAFLGRYKAGRHEGHPACEWFRGTAMRVRSAQTAAVNVDGECFRAQETAFAVVPGCFPFVLPAR